LLVNSRTLARSGLRSPFKVRKAEAIVQTLTRAKLSDIKPFHFIEDWISGVSTITARTGYTGEDGFEIYVPWAEAPKVWTALLEKGAPFGIKPCGLGARDTLRLEVKYPLYGQELTSQTNPLEAGLGWAVKLDKTDFIGKDALIKLRRRDSSESWLVSNSKLPEFLGPVIKFMTLLALVKLVLLRAELNRP